ncbi:MAG: YafY family transcriptional regulator [Alphaproteobacteria bacterium]|nr:YafY family transcriptional regulator [Alphaproteobacteria bacterium]
MRRADRLLQIVQALRRRKRPTTAELLAAELEVSVRTVYRDMAALQASGVPIAGEAGIGYVLRGGYDLPPLMFTVEEIEAIALGAQMVGRTGDAALARAAQDAVAKVEHVLPADLRAALERTALYAPRYYPSAPTVVDLAALRLAVRRAQKVDIAYRDEQGTRTQRRIWPLALAYLWNTAMICAWCELRRDFRHFRADRIEAIAPSDDRFAAESGKLLRRYLATQGAETAHAADDR